MDRILDIGCGYGGLSRLMADYLGSSAVHGIDIDESVFEEAGSKGIITHKINIQEERSQFSGNYFDLVSCFGVLEHLVYFDDVISEICRILRPMGYVLISVPNLASWNNRILLLMGYQPRDIEVARRVVVGAHKMYSRIPIGHIHLVTLRGLRELMEISGFETIKISRGRPYSNKMNPLMHLIDGFLSLKVSLARRIFYLGRKKNQT